MNEVCNHIFDAIHLAKSVRLLSNSELADALICNIWSDESILSLKSALLNEAIKRLKGKEDDKAKEHTAVLPFRGEKVK